MRRRRVLTGFLLTLGSLAGTIFFRRRAARRRERIDVYYEDGSMISVADETEGAYRLLPLARRVLSAARV